MKKAQTKPESTLSDPSRVFHPHLTEPDYFRPLLSVSESDERRLREILSLLYGETKAGVVYNELERAMKVYYAHRTPEHIDCDATFDPTERFTEQDVILITYSDLITSPGRQPLQILSDFLSKNMRDTINSVHILPFYPWSSDRGFSIIDYEEVDPRLGTWNDIEKMAKNFRLMFDGVFNHASSKSRWFQRFLNGRPGYDDFFVSFSDPDAISSDHLRLILRPRTSHLLTQFQTINGPRYVWTTFSPDQVDLNFRNEQVLLRVIETLLLYVRRGANMIRLDAVTYIWRELGTSCAHLRETHAVVQLFRAILDVVAPHVALITETNVPHADNISYFGDGKNEAQMVYNFALPPLVLHTFYAEDSRRFTDWVKTVRPPSDTTAFFNFLSSHDGIGLLGARGLLTQEELDALAARTLDHGGFVSYRSNGDGTESPYELNITWYSALNKEECGETTELQVKRFIAASSISLALQGVPGVYLPTLFGAKNDTQAVLAGAEKRSINRRTFDEASLLEMLDDPTCWVAQVARGMRKLLQRRIEQPAFHPRAPQQVLETDPRAITILRGCPETSSSGNWGSESRGNESWGTGKGLKQLLAVTNISAQAYSLTIFLPAQAAGAWRDVLSGFEVQNTEGHSLTLQLEPYQVLWLSET